jgi:type IV pilus assembly protein PilB
MKKSSKRIGEILIGRGRITEAQVLDALKDQKLSGKFLGSILVEKGLLSEVEVTEALAEQFDLPLVGISLDKVDMELVRKFSSALVIDHKCVPLSEDESSVTVAISNPLDAVALAKLEEEANPRVLKLVLACEKDVDPVVEQYRKYISESIQQLLKRKLPEAGA